MTYELLQKIDKCEYCEEQAEWFFLRVGFWGNIRIKVVCSKHRHIVQEMR